MSIDTHLPIDREDAPPSAHPPAPVEEHPPGRHRRNHPWLVGTGTLLVILAVVFALVGIPAFVRFPLNTDRTIHYNGTFTLYVNQSTLEPLATPTVLPMTISRLVKVTKGSFATAVVIEQDTIRPGPLTLHQNFQYLLNRRTMAFENGPETMMFGQSAKTNIAGSYRLNFPLGSTASGTYPMWSIMTDTAAVVTRGRGPQALQGVSGVKVIEFSSQTAAPASPYYRNWLVQNGFPSSITPAQLVPRLDALGANVSGAFSALLPVLTPAQRATVDRALAAPIPVNYSYSYTGKVAVEPQTGAMIWVDTTAEVTKAAPSPTAAEQLQPLLRQHTDIPAVAELSKALTQVATPPPQTVIDDTWIETPASSQQMANFARNQIRSMNVVDDAPWFVGGVGVVLVALGLLLRRRNT